MAERKFLDNVGLAHLIEKIKAMGPQLSGAPTEIVLGDGTTQSIDTFIENNIETIREKLGVVTQEKTGLVPVLPVKEDE